MQISEIEKGLNPMSEAVSTSTPIRSGRQLVAGDVIVFDVTDENGKVLAGEQPIQGSENVAKVIACHRNGKLSTMNFGELIRYVYASADAEKQTPACPVCEDNFKNWRGMTMSEILADLKGKSYKVEERINAFRRKFGTDEKEATTAAFIVNA